jgi:hypothetical protein
MSFSNVAENAILALIFNATTWANYAINATSSPETTIAVALATGADPGDTATMSTNESTYTNYARGSVARTTGGFSAPSGGSTALVANLDFPASGASGTTITYGQFGKSGGGAADVIVNGAITPNILIGGAGVIPRLTTASTVTLD